MTFPQSFPEAPSLPAGDPHLRWGILGPGGVAGAFVAALRQGTSQIVQGVASRDADRAHRFAAHHGIPVVHESYESLVADPEIDAVYVATIPALHLDTALLAIAARKPVLVEKPFATSSQEAQAIADAADASGVFVMEAMWTRYLPQTGIIHRLIDDGALGDIRLLTADHGQSVGRGGRLWQPGPGSGALLDIGVYPIAFAVDLAGFPDTVSAEGSVTPDGVDTESLMTLGWSSGARAQLSTSMLSRTPMRASVSGTDALLELGSPFYGPTRMTLSRPGWLADAIEWDATARPPSLGMSHQLLAMAGYLAEGRRESPLQPLDESVATLRLIETVRELLA